MLLKWRRRVFCEYQVSESVNFDSKYMGYGLMIREVWLLGFLVLHQKCHANRVQGADLTETLTGSLCTGSSHPNQAFSYCVTLVLCKIRYFCLPAAFVKPAQTPSWSVCSSSLVRNVTVPGRLRFVQQVIQRWTELVAVVAESQQPKRQSGVLWGYTLLPFGTARASTYVRGYKRSSSASASFAVPSSSGWEARQRSYLAED